MRLLGWGGGSGRGGSRWGGGGFVGGLLLVYLLEALDSISFHSVRCSRRNWQRSPNTVANNSVLGIERET